MVKLDHFLVSSNWEAHFPRSNHIGKARLIFDHILICLDIKPPGWGPFPFRFYRSWLLSDGFENLIHITWRDFLSSADPIKKVSYKLKVVKDAIKNWLLSHRND